MFDLEGKRALVTGASGGIGGAIVRSLVRAGAQVALSGTRTDRLQLLADELAPAAAPFPCDLADREAVAGLPGQVVSRLGSLDILVCNAGITRDNLLLRMSDDDWQQVIDINLSAAMRLSKNALRGMMKARWGRVIYVSSVVGFTGNAGQTNYAAAKAGLAGMARSLAAEVAGRQITVNLVAPGFIETDMTAGLSEAQRDSILGRIPTSRMGDVDDIAHAVLYLASNEAGYVTGQTLHVNGGMAMY